VLSREEWEKKYALPAQASVKSNSLPWVKQGGPARDRSNARRTSICGTTRATTSSSTLPGVDDYQLAVLHERWQSAKLREETLTPLDQLLHREAEP
jgi:hypothetical protein